ncbi:hypothetical protein GCM10027168_20420 [Streptomyces capparidis]
MKQLKRSAMVVGGLALALGMTAQGTAQAATGTGYTSPSSYGYAKFNSSTRELIVQDTRADGRRVVAYVWNEDLDGRQIVSGEDANGANGTPGHGTAWGAYEPGDRLSIEVCRRDGASGFLTDCGIAYMTA